MKAIVTIQNSDGSYDEVGMRNRTIIGPYKRQNFIRGKAREYADGKKHRIEWFTDELLRNFSKTEYN